VKDGEIARLKRDISERDLKVKELQDELLQLETVSRAVGCKLALEQELSADDQADMIRKLVGDMKEFKKVEDVKVKVASIREELQKSTADKKVVSEQVTALEAKIKGLTEGLEKSLKANQELMFRLTMEDRLAQHPRADKARKLVAEARPTTSAELDKVLSVLDEETHEPDSEELDMVRDRVRKYSGRGTREHLEEERVPRAKKDENNWLDLGASVGDLRILAGIDK
jgi:ribosomal protein S15P/S13E